MLFGENDTNCYAKIDIKHRNLEKKVENNKSVFDCLSKLWAELAVPGKEVCSRLSAGQRRIEELKHAFTSIRLQ